MTDILQHLLDAQSELQRKMPSPHPVDLFEEYNPGPFDEQIPDDRRAPAIDFIHWNVTAATDELHELLGEIGWKPWPTSSSTASICASRLPLLSSVPRPQM